MLCSSPRRSLQRIVFKADYLNALNPSLNVPQNSNILTILQKQWYINNNFNNPIEINWCFKTSVNRDVKMNITIHDVKSSSWIVIDIWVPDTFVPIVSEGKPT